MPERSNGLGLGPSVLSAYLGSNPSPRTHDCKTCVDYFVPEANKICEANPNVVFFMHRISFSKRNCISNPSPRTHDCKTCVDYFVPEANKICEANPKIVFELIETFF